MTEGGAPAAAIDYVLVHRLQKAYWPKLVRTFTLAKVLRARPICEYVSIPRDTKYDLGRVRHFMLEMRAGNAVDPIVIDTDVIPGRSYGQPPIWLGPIITDGHHRFVAAVLLRRRRIPASISGLVSLAEWLTGKRRHYPLEAL